MITSFYNRREEKISKINKALYEVVGKVSNIQRYSIHDGPGIRTIVFLLGCPLRCLWCANPETQNQKPQIRYFKVHCKGCQRCINACPSGAISLNRESGFVITDRNKCIGCGRCEDACLYHARKLSGRIMSVEEVMSEVLKDWFFYKKSGGGITISGGDPLIQPNFVNALLRVAKKNQIYSMHTTIEISGHCRWNDIKQMLRYLDLIYFDVKHIDPKIHKRLTGKSNETILNNLLKISQYNVPIIIRIPIIPGFTDSTYNIDGIISFIKHNIKSRYRSILGIELMPYHKLGVSKYEHLDREYSLKDLEPPEDRIMNQLIARIKKSGITCPPSFIKLEIERRRKLLSTSNSKKN